MLKKNISIIIVILLFFVSTLFFIPHDKIYKVSEVISPLHFVLDKDEIKIKDLDCFDSSYTEHNRLLASKLKISEEEAFILGNLSKYWASNLMKGRAVFIKDESDLIYFKYSYRTKFLYSGYCFENGKPCFKDAFEKKLKEIRRAKYQVLDLDTDEVYALDNPKVKTLKHFLVLRKSHLPNELKAAGPVENNFTLNTLLNKGDVKVIFTDLTTKLKPDRDCGSLVCKEILSNINNAKSSIDIAIYGYSRTPMIERALKDALNRGVKIRLVYDLDQNGRNIYPDTDIVVNLLHSNMSDKNSPDSGNIMHNKFYIFDDKILITGSANLSHTDMSGFNSNSIIVINSKDAARIYKKEFEQMYYGKFHSEKVSGSDNNFSVSGMEMKAYFSPQDKSVTNAVLPLIHSAKKYIYIPTFVLTEKRVTEELINAKNRGVDVRVIIDALNASGRYSKHPILRAGGVLVKTENFAGKMHSKSMIVDDEYTIIGSMNFSNSGELRNDENLIVIKDSEVAKFYKEFFLYQWNRIDNKWLKYNARAEGKDSIGSCLDGIDNNYDGLIDSDDPACG